MSNAYAPLPSRLLPPLALAASALAAGGCSSRAAPAEAIVLHVARSGDRCTLLIDGRPASNEQLAAAAGAWRGRTISLVGTEHEPYKCIGSVVFALQRAGAKRVGFIGEPPPR